MKQGFNNYIIALIHACMFSPVYLYLLLNTKEMVHFIQEGNGHCESEGSPDSEDSPRAAKHDGQL